MIKKEDTQTSLPSSLLLFLPSTHPSHSKASFKPFGICLIKGLHVLVSKLQPLTYNSAKQMIMSKKQL